MKYFICEGDTIDGKYNATSKAREDVETILKEMSFEPKVVPTINCVQKNKFKKILQYLGYIKNFLIWNKSIKKFNSKDVVIMQYPIIYTSFFFNNIIKKLNKKGVKTIAIIHDLESIRLIEEKGLRKARAVYEDKKVLKEFNKVLSHNKKMTNELIKYGVNKKNIVNLEVFDYLYDQSIDMKKRNYKFPVVIAGNLSSEKAFYLKELCEVNNVTFNLYGKGIDFDLPKNLNYVGCFLPSEVPQALIGSFGLVWDGKSINDITGAYGNYMKYNNPHKISLYLASELPVIVSSKSALADFVIKNNIGITVSSLKELNTIIDSIDKKEYENMLKNVKNISKKIRNGYFLTHGIKKMVE